MADSTGPLSGQTHSLATIRLTGPNTRRPATTAGPLLNFTAPNYLGLADHPRVVAAAHEALDRYGSGPGAGPTVSGRSIVHEELESELCRRLGVEDAVVMPSGSAANHAVLETLAGPNDVIVSDRLNHASIVDGCRLSRATTWVVPHGSIDEFGGAVTGPRWAIEQIRSRGRGYVFSAALPPPATAAALAALRLVFTSDLTRRLWDNQRRFLGLLRSRGLTVDSPTPIVSLALGDHAAARDAADALLRAGILAMPLGPPVTPVDGARIRLVITASHTDHDLTTVAGALATLIPPGGTLT